MKSEKKRKKQNTQIQQENKIIVFNYFVFIYSFCTPSCFLLLLFFFLFFCISTQCCFTLLERYFSFKVFVYITDEIIFTLRQYFCFYVQKIFLYIWFHFFFIFVSLSGAVYMCKNISRLLVYFLCIFFFTVPCPSI